MDIGATLCRPRNPAAHRARSLEIVRRSAQALPRPTLGVPSRRRNRGGKAGVSSPPFRWGLSARRRPAHGLLASTIELPGTPWTAEGPIGELANAAPVAAHWRRLPGEVEQVFTHFALSLTVYAADFEGGAPGRLFLGRAQHGRLGGFSSMMRKAGRARPHPGLGWIVMERSGHRG